MSSDHKPDDADPASTEVSALRLARLFPAVVAFALGGLLGGAVVAGNWSNLGPWLLKFVMQNGGGIGAVVAGLIAYFAVSGQINASLASVRQQASDAKNALLHARATEAANAWWRTFEWAADRALPSSSDTPPVPFDALSSTFEKLAAEAPTIPQKMACGEVMTLLAQEVSPSDDSAIEALRSYNNSTDGTAATSLNARTLVYERDLARALRRNLPTGATYSNLQTAPVDGVVDGLGRHRVFLTVNVSAHAAKLFSKAAGTMGMLPDTTRVAIVSPLKTGVLGYGGARILHWSDESDTADLIEALKGVADEPEEHFA